MHISETVQLGTKGPTDIFKDDRPLRRRRSRCLLPLCKTGTHRGSRTMAQETGSGQEVGVGRVLAVVLMLYCLSGDFSRATGPDRPSGN